MRARGTGEETHLDQFASEALLVLGRASTSLHDPFSPEPSTATEAVLSPMASPALHDSFMPLNQCFLDDSYTIKFSCKLKV